MTDTENSEFNWTDTNLVVEEQLPVACYRNPEGDVVLRQRAAWPDDDDPAIWFGPQHARAIAAAIIQVAGYQTTVPAPEPAQASVKPQATSAAERQKRYRDRRKKEPTPEPNIFDRNDRDAVTAAERDTVTDGVMRNGARDGEAA